MTAHAMEQWSFPPRFDARYAPASGSRYWFPVRETMPPGERERAIVDRLREVTRYAYAHSPFYRAKWDAVGFRPDDLRSLEDFEDKVPIIAKNDLREAQSRVPPFGDYLCIPQHEVHHIHGTSGTTGRPTAFAIGRGDWDAIANAHARIMWGMGIGPGDVVFIAAIFSLYMGSWGALSGAERLGAKAFPFGAGAPGMTARAAMWLDLVKPGALYATPSFALHLAEVARSEGYDPRGFGLKTMFFSGEPGASVPGVRDRIVDAYGARVIDCGSMAEMTPFMHVAGSAETDGMLCWQDIVYTEVCDPVTYRRVPYGQRGTPVYTHLERTSQPMIRLASGDLTLWEDGENACGRTYPRLPQGIFGRIDDMFTIRGENVYPSEVDAVLNTLPGYGGEHRIVIMREGAMDELLIRIEIDASHHAAGGAAHAALRDQAARRLSKMLGLRSKLEIVAPGTFPRTDFKARRTIDDREVFREMNARLGEKRGEG
ncbi:MAG TPA: phenylacetate--CoA ligase family protein [Casimicrobiaceae bacterium]|nr:phenylacetate--CoA ligase family protein [Casimicrobiaceae bacterium]